MSESQEDRARTVAQIRARFHGYTHDQLTEEFESLNNILDHASELNLDRRQLHDLRVEQHTVNELLDELENPNGKRKKVDDLNPNGKKRALTPPQRSFYGHHNLKSKSNLQKELRNLNEMIKRERDNGVSDDEMWSLFEERDYVQELINLSPAERKKRKAEEELTRQGKRHHGADDSDVEMTESSNELTEEERERKYDSEDEKQPMSSQAQPRIEIPNRDLDELLDEIDRLSTQVQEVEAKQEEYRGEPPPSRPQQAPAFTVPATPPSAPTSDRGSSVRDAKEKYKISGSVTLTPKSKRKPSNYNIIYGEARRRGMSHQEAVRHYHQVK